MLSEFSPITRIDTVAILPKERTNVSDPFDPIHAKSYHYPSFSRREKRYWGLMKSGEPYWAPREQLQSIQRSIRRVRRWHQAKLYYRRTITRFRHFSGPR